MTLELPVNWARALYLVILLGGWEATVRLRLISNLILPSLGTVASATYAVANGTSKLPNFYSHFQITLAELSVAYVIIVLLGVLLGLGLGTSKLAWEAFSPGVFALFSIPIVILYPIIYLVLGLGPNSKIAFGVIVGLLPTLVNTAAGARQVKREQILVARSMGLGSFGIFSRVIFPASAPDIISGLRLGYSGALAGVTVAEYIASQAGLGNLIGYAFDQRLIGEVYFLFILIVAMSLVGNLLLARLEARIRR